MNLQPVPCEHLPRRKSRHGTADFLGLGPAVRPGTELLRVGMPLPFGPPIAAFELTGTVSVISFRLGRILFASETKRGTNPLML